jgi:hypothetical protein
MGGQSMGNGIWWPITKTIIPGLIANLCARATYCENKSCTTATLQKLENIT